MSKAQITTNDVLKIAKLANLPITETEADLYATQFQKTLSVVDELKELDTNSTVLTGQVNNLVHVTRPDRVDKERMFTQAEALSGAKNVHKGYFVVNQILDKND